MKRTITKLTALVFAVILSVSIGTPAAFAADETIVPKTVTTTDTIVTEQPSKEEIIAQFKAEVIRLVNIEREKMGIAPVKEMDILNPMADVRAQESATLFKHTRPNGKRCFTIFAENGMKYRAVGENLAYGFKTPAAVVAAWMRSASHRANILDPDFKFIGIGYFVKDNGKIYCTQLFYTPKNVK